MNEVAQHQAQLVLACYQPPRSTQPGHPFVVGAVSASISWEGSCRSGITLCVTDTVVYPPDHPWIQQHMTGRWVPCFFWSVAHLTFFMLCRQNISYLISVTFMMKWREKEYSVM